MADIAFYRMGFGTNGPRDTRIARLRLSAKCIMSSILGVELTF